MPVSIGNTWSSPRAESRLVDVALEHLVDHPANANEMSREMMDTLKRNIERNHWYPPICIRPLEPPLFQVIDGHVRKRLLGELGFTTAKCVVWPCDDVTALLLLGTLNTLHGEDVPVRRASLIAELTAILPPAELALLLPEDEQAIADLLSLLDVDSDRLLADLTAAAARESASAVRAVTFALDNTDEAVVERAVATAMSELAGTNRRGRALTAICREYLERRGA
jgi:ParB-like chromosome segregation protein Spo0J